MQNQNSKIQKYKIPIYKNRKISIFMMKKKTQNKVNISLKTTKRSKLGKKRKKKMASITRYYYTLLDRSHVVLDSKILWTNIKTLQKKKFCSQGAT